VPSAGVEITAVAVAARRAPAPPEAPLRLGLFGCALDTGNLGVSALGIASVRGLEASGVPVECTLFDHQPGSGWVALCADDWSSRVRRIGCAYSRRPYRSANLQQVYLAARLGLARLQPVLAEIARLDAILDLSGGDSFSDLYGGWRFRSIALPKRLALRLGLPLVLLPQTYGPFRRARRAATARRILRAAHQVWARDPGSLALARGLLGPAFDPARHRAGVDVAFGLPVKRPESPELVGELLALRREPAPLFGVNVSGLLYNRADVDRERFGLRSSYRELVERALRGLLEIEGARLLLVPHVGPPCTASESDAEACRAAAASLGPKLAPRIRVAPPLADPMQAKWVVGRCQWFLGTRLHACIAALSQGIPTASLVYSDKARGVLEMAGAGRGVVDPRALDAGGAVGAVVASARERVRGAREVARALPALRERLSAQFRSIASSLAERRAAAEGAPR
jgi:polysaccharide pyruvyl transferase WcaK-like protein